MEKIIYALWRNTQVSRADFNKALLEGLSHELAPMVHALRFNLQDAAVESVSAPCYVATEPQMDGFIQLWADSAVNHLRAPIDQAIAPYAHRYEAWLVSESAVLRNKDVPFEPGQRLPAYNHMAVISVPPRLTWRAWQDRWQNHHTQVAVETQSNFEYLQNLIVRPLTYTAPAYAAFIEESFPAEAAHDEATFLGAVGDTAKLADHRDRLYSSTFSFVDQGGFDLVPTSQFDIKRIGE
jgi:EthD domain